MIDANSTLSFKNEPQPAPEANEEHPRLAHAWEEATHSWARIFTTHFSCAKVREHYGKVITDTTDDKVNSVKKFAQKIGGCCCGERIKTETDLSMDYEAIPKDLN